MITRRSLVMLTVDEPQRCHSCGPDVSPHDIKRELKYLRDGVPVVRFVCAYRLEAVLDDVLSLESEATAVGVVAARERKQISCPLDERSGANCSGKGGV